MQDEQDRGADDATSQPGRARALPEYGRSPGRDEASPPAEPERPVDARRSFGRGLRARGYVAQVYDGPAPAARTPAADHRAESRRGRGVPPRSYTRTDDRIYEAVCERLIDEGLDCGAMDVGVRSGVVTLVGQVRVPRDRETIQRLAAGITGVVSVDNQLKTEDSPSGSVGIGAAAAKGAARSAPWEPSGQEGERGRPPE